MAKSSLDICMFHITNKEIIKALKLICKKVDIRIITHQQNIGKGVNELIKKGIVVKVRNDNSESFMHCKYCIVDKEILIAGSLNWTNQGTKANNENVVKITD